MSRSTSPACWPSRPTRWPRATSCRKQARRSRRRRSPTSTIIGRRGPEQASFTNNELAEMGRLARAVALVDPAALKVEAPKGDPTPERLPQGQEPRDPARLCRQQARQQSRSRCVSSSIRRSKKSGRRLRSRHHLHWLHRRTLPQWRGHFPVGWAKRGPTGTIPTNRGESHAVAQQVLAWLKDREPQRAGRSDTARRRSRGLASASTRPRWRPVRSSAGLA